MSWESAYAGDYGGTAVLERGVTEPDYFELYLVFADDPPITIVGELLTFLEETYQALLRAETEGEVEQLRLRSIHSGASILATIGGVLGIGKVASWLQDRWKTQEEIRKLRAEQALIKAQTEEANAAAERHRVEIRRIDEEGERAAERHRLEMDLRNREIELAKLRVAQASLALREAELDAAEKVSFAAESDLAASGEAETVANTTQGMLERLRSGGIQRIRINGVEIDLAA